MCPKRDASEALALRQAEPPAALPDAAVDAAVTNEQQPRDGVLQRLQDLPTGSFFFIFFEECTYTHFKINFQKIKNQMCFSKVSRPTASTFRKRMMNIYTNII